MAVEVVADGVDVCEEGEVGGWWFAMFGENADTYGDERLILEGAFFFCLQRINAGGLRGFWTTLERHGWIG